MYYSLKGTLIYTEPGMAVIECGGVGYQCHTTLRTTGALPPVGEQATLYTHLNVREDAMDLYGFLSTDERNAYRLLTGVSGVGPKSALSILSDLTPDAFALCVASGDVKTLQKAPGIGAKAAQRIILELKGKLRDMQVTKEVLQTTKAMTEQERTNISEAVDALCALGYTQSEAVKALSGANPEDSAQTLIRLGLKAMQK